MPTTGTPLLSSLLSPLIALAYPSTNEPTGDGAEDILHVRLQTLGVTEHTFDINFGGGHYNWYLYDVGGAVSPSFLF